MNTQAFIHTTEPTPDEMDPITNAGPDNPGISVKPRGGLWTSTFTPDEEFTCGWHDWCHSEHWGLSDESQLWLLEPADDVNVLVIDGMSDLIELVDEYERTDLEYKSPSMATPDFETIAERYDGMRLTANGQRETRFSNPSLYGWDCESTVWFDWQFTSVERERCIGNDFADYELTA